MLEKNKLIVVSLVVLSTFSAAILGSCVKYISNDLNPLMICFYRTFFGLMLILPFLLQAEEIFLSSALIADGFKKPRFITSDPKNS